MSDPHHDWDEMPLGDIANVINGRAYKLSEWEESGTPVIRLQNLTQRGGNFYYSNLRLPENQYCHKGDLLYMWSATFGPHIWWGDKAIYHYHIWKIEPKEQIDKNFLFYLLEAKTEEWKAAGSGMAMIHLTKAGIEKEMLPVPPLPEQKKIAEILSGIDRQIKLYETKIKSVESKKKALLNSLYGEPFDSEDNLQDLCTEDICYGVLQYNEEGEGSIPVIQIRNLTPLDLINLKRIPIGLDEKYARSRVQEGDLLISVKGSVGKTAVVPKGFSGNISRDIARVRSKESVISARFLQYWFASGPGVASLAKIEVGTTRAELSIGKLRSLQVSYPSIEEQHKICRVARSTEKTLANLNNIKDKHLILKKAISMDLLSGRKRVSI